MSKLRAAQFELGQVEDKGAVGMVCGRNFASCTEEIFLKEVSVIALVQGKMMLS